MVPLDKWSLVAAARARDRRNPRGEPSANMRPDESLDIGPPITNPSADSNEWAAVALRPFAVEGAHAATKVPRGLRRGEKIWLDFHFWPRMSSSDVARHIAAIIFLECFYQPPCLCWSVHATID
jgi:hypothetical protein